MPFIRGRYYMNPIVGEAIEAARAAEEALAELEQSAHDDIANSAGSPSNSGANASDGEDDFGDDGSCATSSARAARTSVGPIHRVEIEAAEVVPSHTGRAQRGYVANVHREVSAGRLPTRAGGGFGAGGTGAAAPQLRMQAGDYPSAAYAARPETHVFSDHRDQVSFLRDEFAKDCRK